jgi:hypothetical protein
LAKGSARHRRGRGHPVTGRCRVTVVGGHHRLGQERRIRPEFSEPTPSLMSRCRPCSRVRLTEFRCAPNHLSGGMSSKRDPERPRCHVAVTTSARLRGLRWDVLGTFALVGGRAEPLRDVEERTDEDLKSAVVAARRSSSPEPGGVALPPTLWTSSMEMRTTGRWWVCRKIGQIVGEKGSLASSGPSMATRLTESV